MTAPGDDEPQTNLLSGISDFDAVSHLLADRYEDFPRQVARLHHLAGLGRTLGPLGAMFFGESAPFSTWMEARSSFVHHTSAATSLLYQSPVENLLAAFRHAAKGRDTPPRSSR